MFLVPDVQMLDGTIQRMNIRENNCIILEIVIYPVDSVTHLTNNWSLEKLACKQVLCLEIPRTPRARASEQSSRH